MKTRMKKLLLALGLLFAPMLVQANLLPILPTVKTVTDYPSQYVVQGGEQWETVLSYFVLEPQKVLYSWGDEVPELRAGDVISMLQQSGQMLLQIKQGRTVKLQPRIRVVEESREKPVIPVETIQQFLNRPALITDEEQEEAGYVVANSSKKLLASVGDELYIRGLNIGVHDKEFMLVRPGQAFTSMDGTETYAHEAIYLGDAELVAWSDDVVTLKLTSVNREILTGDLVLPLEEQLFRENFEPKAPDVSVLGDDTQIVAVVDGVTQIGQYQVVVVNRGDTDGLEVGHVLAVMQRGGEVIDRNRGNNDVVTLPDQQAGTLLVFRVFDTVSYALVMRALHSIKLFDAVTVP